MKVLQYYQIEMRKMNKIYLEIKIIMIIKVKKLKNQMIQMSRNQDRDVLQWKQSLLEYKIKLQIQKMKFNKKVLLWNRKNRKLNVNKTKRKIWQ